MIYYNKNATWNIITKPCKAEFYKVLIGFVIEYSNDFSFFGESMFSRVSNASKIALITLAEVLKENNFEFIDCQVYTEHLESMGARMVPWNEFKAMLHRGIYQ